MHFSQLLRGPIAKRFLVFELVWDNAAGIGSISVANGTARGGAAGAGGAEITADGGKSAGAG